MIQLMIITSSLGPVLGSMPAGFQECNYMPGVLVEEQAHHRA